MRRITQSSPAVYPAVIISVLILFLTPMVAAQENTVGLSVKDMVAEAKQQTPSMTIEELAALMAEKHEIKLIDCRTEAEYLAGHLRGARWLPRGKLEFDAAKGELGSTADTIVVYCKRDGRSALAAATLRRLGFANASTSKAASNPGQKAVGRFITNTAN
ncbi:rhodanese-like domain-containing protein [Candidatus Zixiibacteriota bacterium]